MHKRGVHGVCTPTKCYLSEITRSCIRKERHGNLRVYINTRKNIWHTSNPKSILGDDDEEASEGEIEGRTEDESDSEGEEHETFSLPSTSREELSARATSEARRAAQSFGQATRKRKSQVNKKEQAFLNVWICEWKNTYILRCILAHIHTQAFTEIKYRTSLT